MAQGKKSVLLYCDIIHTVEPLTDEEAGRLFKHYLRYINDQNPDPIDRLTGLLFEPIKQNLKRDLAKWESKSLKNSENAKIRWDKNNANACERIESNANYADKDTVTVTDTVNVKVNNIEERKLKFASTLEPYLKVYGREMLSDFYKYWTEPNKSNTKFKQETEKTWSLERRLETWAKNESKFAGSKPQQQNQPQQINKAYNTRR
jgi:hypothetical protein